jgi:hypothetical protein
MTSFSLEATASNPVVTDRVAWRVPVPDFDDSSELTLHARPLEGLMDAACVSELHVLPAARMRAWEEIGKAGVSEELAAAVRSRLSLGNGDLPPAMELPVEDASKPNGLILGLDTVGLYGLLSAKGQLRVGRAGADLLDRHVRRELLLVALRRAGVPVRADAFRYGFVGAATYGISEITDLSPGFIYWGTVASYSSFIQWRERKKNKEAAPAYLPFAVDYLGRIGVSALRNRKIITAEPKV